MQLNPLQVEVGREWLKGQGPADRAAEDDPEPLPFPQIELLIRQCYPGGIDRFMGATALPLRGADAAD